MAERTLPWTLRFVQPFTRQMSFSKFMDLLPATDCVRYMQSQDNNMNKEFAHLQGMPKSLTWADAVLGEPEAVNLWIGESRTVSRLHNDNYENIFCQVTGEKLIALIPPTHAYYVAERRLRGAHYVRQEDGSFQIVDDEYKTVFPTFDPSEDPLANDFVYWVRLGPGDALYVPALWYHQIQITTPFSVSVNYWYNSTDLSSHWSMWNMSREILLGEDSDSDDSC